MKRINRLNSTDNMYRPFYFTTFLTALALMFFVGNVSAQKNKKKNKEGEARQLIIKDDKETTAEAEYYLTEGMKYYITDEFTKALEYFQRSLSLSNDNASIHFKIAETYIQLGNLERAEYHAKAAFDKDKTNKYIYILLAKVYEKRQKINEAIEVYQAMLESKIASEEYYYEIAELYLKQNNTEKALNAYNQLEKIIGINEVVIAQKQKIYLRANQLDKAIAEGNKLLNSNPTEASYIVSLGELMLLNKQMDEAQRMLEKATQENNNEPKIALLLAKIYRSKGEEANAIQQLKIAFANPELDPDEKINWIVSLMEKSETSTQQNNFLELTQLLIQVHPAHAKAYSLYADLLLLQNNKDGALKNYLMSARLDNSKAEIWQRVLALDAEANRMDSLIKHSDQALELFPNQALFWMYNGMGFLAKREYEKAVNAFEEGKRLTFNNKELLEDFNLRLGDAYNGLKQYPESDASYEAVLKNSPNNTYALNNYSYYLALRKEKLDIARQLAERLINNEPENATYLDTYGWVLYQSKEYKKARKFLEKAASNSSSGIVLEHFGDVLFKLGEVDKALEQWGKAKKLGGTSALLDKKIANKNLYE